MNLTAFRARFPEFRTATDVFVQSVLDEATRFVAPETFLDLTDDAIGYWAAHLISTSPMGISQRLDDDKTETTYLKNYRALLKATAIRLLVT